MIGTVLENKYEILRLIGQGGMGAVYEARHNLIDRRVAIKVLHPDIAKLPNVVERFRREARIAGSLGHRNICEVTDLGLTPEGAPFMVMPLLEGESLSSLIGRTRGPLPFRWAAGVTRQILSALEATHAKGVVHRDLKPENVFLETSGGQKAVVKVLDFGVSKAAVEGPGGVGTLTQTGAVMGTPLYMAPEQAKGSKHVDHRADLYAVGVILYELVTGVRPYAGDSHNEVIIKIVTEPFAPPRQVNPSVPPELEAVIVKAMEKDPARRFESATAFSAALTALAPVLAAETVAPPVLAPTPAGGQPGLALSMMAAGGVAHPGDPAAALARTAPSEPGAGGSLYQAGAVGAPLPQVVSTPGAGVPAGASIYQAGAVATPASSAPPAPTPATTPLAGQSATATTPAPRPAEWLRTVFLLLKIAAVVVGVVVTWSLRSEIKTLLGKKDKAPPEKTAHVTAAAPASPNSKESARSPEQPADGTRGMEAGMEAVPASDHAPSTTSLTEMVSIPAACFQRGSPDGDPDEVPVSEVCLPGYQIDRTEVMVNDFRRCVAAGRCTVTHRFSEELEDGKPTWKRFCNYGQDDRGGHPMNCVLWSEAKAYCEWAGKRLPTEAEWELAARGTDGRRYPWGNDGPTCDRAIMDDAGGEGCGKGRTWLVGSKPRGAGPYGTLDQAGNVWEWVEDCWEMKFYRQCGDRCSSPVNRCTKHNPQRVIRGGTFSTRKAAGLRSSLRGNYAQRSTEQTIGFRCARDTPAGGVSATGTEQMVKVVGVTVSSNLPRYQTHVFTGDKLLDGRLDTSWQPKGSDDDCVGQWFELDLGKEVEVTRLEVANGYQIVASAGDEFLRNSRVKEATITWSDGLTTDVTVETEKKNYVTVTFPPKRTSKLRFTIRSVVRGSRYRDVAVSEVKVFGR